MLHRCQRHDEGDNACNVLQHCHHTWTDRLCLVKEKSGASQLNVIAALIPDQVSVS